MTICFELVDLRSLPIELTDLQRAEFNSAANFHALRNPHAIIDMRVHIGDPHQLPILTDERTITGHDSETPAAFTVRIRSKATGAEDSPPSAQPLTRNLRLAHPDATVVTTNSDSSSESLSRRVYRFLERLSPQAADFVRETITHRREGAIGSHLPRYRKTGSGSVELRIQQSPTDDVPPHLASKPAILFGLHWLQTGGAERWAVDSIRIAKEAGFLPIVVTDNNSIHPWLTMPELNDCVVICLSSPDSEVHEPTLIQAVAQNFDLRGAVVHHSKWLYRTLPWLRLNVPDVLIVDSLHIVEYLEGGFPGYAVRFDDFIDLHHTISPELTRWLCETQGVDDRKVVLAPLASLTVHEQQSFKEREKSREFTIAFVGRLSRQKRPDVFLMLVRHLRRIGVPVRAILHGEGELQPLTHALIARFKLDSIVELRDETIPVYTTLRDSDLLVVTSMNEGLTLTTFEAVAAGIPVLSTDVGSQMTIVHSELLAPRPARQFVRKASRQIQELISSDDRRQRAWETQRDLVSEFSRLQSSQEWFSRLIDRWK